jgi:hypothetical protein
VVIEAHHRNTRLVGTVLVVEVGNYCVFAMLGTCSTPATTILMEQFLVFKC